MGWVGRRCSFDGGGGAACLLWFSGVGQGGSGWVGLGGSVWTVQGVVS